MSLQIRDTLSLGIRDKIRALSDSRPVLEAMGVELASITKRAFSDPALRPSPWPARKNTRLETNPKTGRQKTVSAATGKQTWSLLRKSGALMHSIRITQVTNNSVTVGSDRPYAAVHQFGSRKKKGRGGGIPARPYFPYEGPPGSATMTPMARKKVEAVATAKLRRLLGN